MNIGQSDLRDAILDASLPTPSGLLGPNDAPAGKRFDVYRNNVVYSLTQALGAAFPMVKKLIGSASFEKLAGIYVRKHPPQSPLMMHYGAEFPEFIARFEPLKKLGYLADCARLDIAMRQSYHAATSDRKFLEPTDLKAQNLANLKLGLAPASIIVRSVWPLFDIWRYNFETNAPAPKPVPQDVLVTRQEWDPAPHALPVGGACWLETLDRGEDFITSHETTLNTHAEFDLSAMLNLVLACEALTIS